MTTLIFAPVLTFIGWAGPWLLATFPFLGSIVAFIKGHRPLIFGLMLLSAYAYGWWNGSTRAETKCQTAALTAKLKATESDLAAAQKTAAEANNARQELQSAASAAQQRIDDYAQIIAKLPACPPISDDDIRRVRGRSGSRTR